MPTNSTAQLFFNEMVAKGTPAIEGLVTQKQPETEWLDFKAGNLDDKGLKEKFSEAVCGFANNQGGVLIIGIDARKDPHTNVDAASSTIPLPDPTAVCSRLRELLRNATEPPVMGVQLEAFHQTGVSGPGYVVCMVPESNSKPHRAEYISGKPYMIRVSDSFQNPSPSLLRNLFFPRSSAIIWATGSPHWEKAERSGQKNYCDVGIALTIGNQGTASAKGLFIVFECDQCSILGFSEGRAVGGYLASRKIDDDSLGTEYGAPLHPMDHRLFGSLVIRVDAYTDGTPRDADLDIVLTAFAEDMAPMKLLFKFNARDIENRISRPAIPQNP